MLAGLFPLEIGSMEDVFHTLGNLPEQIDVFTSFTIPRAMLTAVCFSIVANIPSGPLDLVVSSDNNISRMTSSVHSSCSGHKHSCWLSLS